MIKRLPVRLRSVIFHFILSTCTISFVYVSCDDKTAGPDSASPKVTIIHPVRGERIDTTTTINVEIVPRDAIEKVDFFIDYELIGFDYEWPYEKEWYVSFWAEDSIHTIFVEATDTSGIIVGSDILRAIVDYSAVIIPEIIFPEDGHVVTEPGLFIIQLYRIDGATGYWWYSHPMDIEPEYFTCDDEICYGPERKYYSGCMEVPWRLYIHTPGKTIQRKYTYYVAIDCDE